MKGSRKAGLPTAFTEWLSLAGNDWQPTYNGLDRSTRDALIHALLAEQRGLCVYCGRKLNLDKPGKTFHVEHFRPQHLFQYHQVTYHNLFLSCGQEDIDGLPAPTCGNKKGDWFDRNLHVYPQYPHCTARFRFLLNGGIEPAHPADLAAKEMIVQLGLDHPALENDGKNVFQLVDEGKLKPEDYWDDHLRLAESYAHIVFQSRGLTLP